MSTEESEGAALAPSDTMKPILVIGATGRHGRTGASVLRQLRSHGYAVRALTRRKDERVQPLESLGAEIAIGDLRDRRSLLAALEEVEVAYFTYPGAPGIVDAAANFASAGRAAGLKRVVVMSMAVAHPAHPSPFARAQWLAEEVFEWAGFSCLFLRISGLFVENLELYHRADIEGDGVIRNSFSDVAVSWITGEDAGKLAVAALLHPERFGDKMAVYPSGGKPFSHAEVADLLGLRLGRTLRHETISQEAWQERLIALSVTDDRLNPLMAAHISNVGAAMRQSPPSNDLFEALTGERPQSLPEVLEFHLAPYQWGAPLGPIEATGVRIEVRAPVFRLRNPTSQMNRLKWLNFCEHRWSVIAFTTRAILVEFLPSSKTFLSFPILGFAHPWNQK